MKELRDGIVSRGKRDERFIALGKAKGRRDAKYSDPEDLEKSGAISEKEMQFLYDQVKQKGMLSVVEIGTWFGTSAAAMIEAGAEVDSCDRHDVCVVKDERHERLCKYTMASTEFLKRMKSLRHAYDMAFIDGKLKNDDAKLLLGLLRPPRLIILHDWKYGSRKGDYNVALLRKRKKFKVIPVDGTYLVMLKEK
jgi:predicted O-methyltransferase YrrM